MKKRSRTPGCWFYAAIKWDLPGLSLCIMRKRYGVYSRTSPDDPLDVVCVANEGDARLIAAAPELLDTLSAVYVHLDELAVAWQRGALNESDGQGGTRSNRNRALMSRIETAVTKAIPPKPIRKVKGARQNRLELDS